MTKNLALLLALLAVLAACGDGSGSNPISDRDDTEDADDGDDGDFDDEDDDVDDDSGIDSDGGLPPGTASPTPKTGITRYEDYDEDSGSGFVTNVSYDSTTDQFTVDNLGFDANNVYERDNIVGSLGVFAVYENDDIYPDSLTGTAINQLSHKAIYGITPSGQAELAIVRTGAYVGYGYGGFIYARNGSVTLPTSGQASYSGDYAALRDFQNRGGLEYATGDMTMEIDFEDFNDGSAVKGYVTNRTIFDLAGNDITQDVLDAISDETGTSTTSLPTLRFKIGPGVLDANGELVGEINSYVNNGGTLEEFETGNYYAVISGDNAEDVVGVIVVESDDYRYDDVTVRETGGFILAR